MATNFSDKSEKFGSGKVVAIPSNMKLIKNILAKFAKVVVVIGDKGCAVMPHYPKSMLGKLGEAIVHVWAGYKATQVSTWDIGAVQADGKSATILSPRFDCYQAGCFLSNEKKVVRAYYLPDAVKKGLVKIVDVTITKAGKSETIPCVVSSTWESGQSFGLATQTQYIGALANVHGNASGRWETKLISDKRNERMHASLSEPKAATTPKASATKKSAVKAK